MFKVERAVSFDKKSRC